MSYADELLFVVTTLRIYMLSLQVCEGNVTSLSNCRLLGSMSLPTTDFICSSELIAIRGRHVSTVSSIAWCTQNARSDLKVLELNAEPCETGLLSYSLAEVTDDAGLEPDQNVPDLFNSVILHHRLGTSLDAALLVTVDDIEWHLPPRIRLGRIYRCDDDFSHASDQIRPKRWKGRFSDLSSERRPSSHLISCVDFDDGHDIVAVGYHTGEFVLSFLTPAGSLLRDGTLHELPYAVDPVLASQSIKVTKCEFSKCPSF